MLLPALLEPPASEWKVPTANGGLIAPKCFASQRCDLPIPPPTPTHLSLIVASEQIWPQGDVLLRLSSLKHHLQLCNTSVPLGMGNAVIKTITILLHRRLYFFFPLFFFLFWENLQPKWNRLCLGGFLWNITGSSCHKERKASAARLLQLQVDHLALNEGQEQK